MGDIYATPEADLAQRPSNAREGGSVEDAINGNIEVSVLETLGEAWRGMKGFKLKCHIASVLWFVIYMLALLVSLPVTMGLMAIGATPEVASVIAWFVQLVAISITFPMMVGITVMAIRHARGKSVSASTVFNYFRRAPAAILWYLLMTVLIFIGYLLLVLPGIYLTFAYMFSLPLLVEKNMGVWQALEVSRKAVSKFWFRATGFLLLIMLVVTLGMIPLMIPLIWIVPWVTLAYALLYFKLFGAEPATLAD